jgi:CBS domain-containing protein
MMLGILSGACALIVAWMVTRRALRRKQLTSPRAKASIRAAMNRKFHAVRSDESLGEAARWSVQTGHDLPIVDAGTAVGVLTRHDLVDGLVRAGEDAAVSRAPHHCAITVAPGDSVEGVAAQLASAPHSIAVVIDGQTAVGIITAEDLATFVALHGDRPELR